MKQFDLVMLTEADNRLRLNKCWIESWRGPVWAAAATSSVSHSADTNLRLALI